MSKHLVSLNDLPPSGKDFTITDQDVWLDPIKEFKMECRVTSPLEMKVSVKTTDEGCLVRGSITGAITLPCNRCAENANVDLDAGFDEYEEIPAEHAPEGKSGDSHIVFERNAPMLDLSEVAWEQFMLALPANPLCREDCKGLCPVCGANLNLGSCGCAKDSGDPRMAAFRNMTIEDD